MLPGQDLGEVLAVEVAELPLGQRLDLGPHRLGHAPLGGASPVATGQPSRPETPVAGQQPPLLPQGDP
jgi:hypothetical protein